MEAAAGKKGNEMTPVVLIPQLFNNKSQDTAQVKAAQVKPIEPRPYLKRGSGSHGSESLKRINRMNEDFGNNEGQGLVRKSSKTRQNSHIHLPQIPVHIPSDSETYKTKPTLKKFVIKPTKTVKSQVPHEPSSISDLSKQKKPTDIQKYLRLLQKLKESIRTKDMKPEDMQRQLWQITSIFGQLLSDIQKKLEFHKAGPQRSKRYQAKRRLLEQKLEQAEKDLKEYQERLKKADSLYKEAGENPKAVQLKVICQKNEIFIRQCRERISSLSNQRYQLEQEIKKVILAGVQPFSFQKYKLLNTKKDHAEIQNFINMLIRERVESQLTGLRRKLGQLLDKKDLISEKMQKAQEKELSVQKMKQLKAEYIDVEKNIAYTEQEIGNAEQFLKSQA